MRSRRGTTTQPEAPSPQPPAPDDGYQTLNVAEILSDLPSLGIEQLLLVKSLEEQGQQRPVILDRIADLMVVQEAARHLAAAVSVADAPAAAAAPPAPQPPPARAVAPTPRATRSAPPAPPRAPAPPQAPAPRPKDVSPDLLDQMGGLLAKNAAERTSDFQAAWPQDRAPAPSAQPLAPPSAPPLPPPAKHAPEATSSSIMPTDGRRSRGRGRARLVIGLVIVAMLGAGAAVYWRQSHNKKSATPAAATTGQPSRDLVGERIVKVVPAGYVLQADSVGDLGPSDLAKAVRDDAGPGAEAALTAAGFLHGYQRMWANAGNQNALLVFIYHFRTPVGATAYLNRVVQQEKTTQKPVPTGFAVAGIPGAVGLAGTQNSAHVAQVLFTRGSYVASVAAVGPLAPPLPATAQQLAAAQYALL